MNYVLTELNAAPPDSPEALFYRTEQLMLNETVENFDPETDIWGMPVKDMKVFKACLPAGLAASLEAEDISMMHCFGSASMMSFGQLCLKQNGRLASTLSTAILFMPSAKVRQYRGYWDILQRNQGLGDPDELGDYYTAFYHPIPGTQERLPLMQIGTPARLKPDYLARFADPSPFENEIVDIQNVPVYGPIQLLFLHPPYNLEYQRKLLACLQPAWDVIHAAPEPEGGCTLPAAKEDALIEIYWLLAQTTPPDRGGSAFARVILEHLSYVLQQQGYEHELPFTAVGVDLWAEAVTLPLDDEGPHKPGFKTRFKNGSFFDRDATPEQVLADLNFKSPAAKPRTALCI